MASKPLALKPAGAQAPVQAQRPMAAAPATAQQAQRPMAAAPATQAQAQRPMAAAPATQAQALRSMAAAPATQAQQAPRPMAAAPATAQQQQQQQAVANTRPPIIVDNVSYRLFSTKTRDAVDNLAILKDKVIKLDYWVPSLDKKCIIGMNKSGDKYLILNDVEYTSKIVSCRSVAGTDEMVIETEYSIYIVAKGISTRATVIGEADDSDDIITK